MAPPSPASIMPTAARSRVGTSEMAAAGKSASARPSTSAAWMAFGRAEAVGAAAQDHGVAGLQAQHAGVGGHVRPAFVDHADDAERDAHTLDAHAVGTPPGGQDRPDRILELAHDIDPGRHRLDALGIERQAIEKGRGDARGFGFGDILRVGSQDRRSRGADRRRHGGERAVLARRRGEGEHMRRSAGVAADLQHGRFKRAGTCYRFERGVHGLDPSCVTVSYHVRRGTARRLPHHWLVHTAPQLFAFRS